MIRAVVFDWGGVIQRTTDARPREELAAALGLTRQVLVLNRAQPPLTLPAIAGLPPLAAMIPPLSSLAARQLASPSVLGLPQHDIVDRICRDILCALHARVVPEAEGGIQPASPR